MEAPPQQLVFVERNAFSRPAFSDDEELKCLSENSFSDDEELKCLSENSDFFEDLLHDDEEVDRPYARSLRFSARKQQGGQQKPKLNSKKAKRWELFCRERNQNKSSLLSTSVTKSGRPSWADLHDDSSEEEGNNFGEQIEGYSTDQSGDACIPAPSATGNAMWQETAPLRCKGPEKCSLAKPLSPMTLQQVLVKDCAVEFPLLVWDPIGISEERVGMPSEHLASKLTEDHQQHQHYHQRHQHQHQPSDKRNSAMDLKMWSCSTTSSSLARDFEELLEEMPPPLSPSIQMPSTCRQPPMANLGASHQQHQHRHQHHWPSDKRNSAINFEMWSCSSTSSSLARDFEELLEEMPPPLSPSIQMPRRQPLMANPSASQQTPIATEMSPCLEFGITRMAMAVPVIPVFYPVAPTTGMWWNCEAPEQEPQRACHSVGPEKQVQCWGDTAGEQQRQPGLTTTGLAGTLSNGGAMRGPCFGNLHRFHHSLASMGALSTDLRSFTKTKNKNRLSIACEDSVHGNGISRYAVRFTSGELSNADGVGFILSNAVPCTKNIQRIVSLFVNRTGRICVRMKQDVERISARVKAIELGDWLEVVTDLEQRKLTFIVWPQDNSSPSSVTVGLGKLMKNAAQPWPCGYLAVVVKNVGVSVALGS